MSCLLLQSALSVRAARTNSKQEKESNGWIESGEQIGKRTHKANLKINKPSRFSRSGFSVYADKP
jgi:hypothetical protein